MKRSPTRGKTKATTEGFFATHGGWPRLLLRCVQPALFRVTHTREAIKKLILPLEQMPEEISEMVAAPRGFWAGRGGRAIPVGLDLPPQHSQETPEGDGAPSPGSPRGGRPFLKRFFQKRLRGGPRAQWPVCGVIGRRPRSMDIGLCLFLADKPFRLGHLEISSGICSSKPSPGNASFDRVDGNKTEATLYIVFGPIISVHRLSGSCLNGMRFDYSTWVTTSFILSVSSLS